MTYRLKLTAKCSHCGRLVDELVPFGTAASCIRCFNFQLEIAMRRGRFTPAFVRSQAHDAMMRWFYIVRATGGEASYTTSESITITRP